MKWSYFDKYLEDDHSKYGKCINNRKNKIFVFYEKIGAQGYYIKKYTPYKKKLLIALGIEKDKVYHYERVCQKLEKIGVDYIKVEYKKIKKESLFERKSIMVMKDGGVSLEKIIKEYSKEKILMRDYYNLFIKLCKNGICPIDYNLGGMLLGEDRKLRLIDFDDYKIKKYISKKLKQRLIRNLRRIYINKNRSREDEEYLKSEIDRVIDTLNWRKDL